ncbi:hypothetical protein MHYP_G00068060 [Metynnis hypsauchen]
MWLLKVKLKPCQTQYNICGVRESQRPRNEERCLSDNPSPGEYVLNNKSEKTADLSHEYYLSYLYGPLNVMVENKFALNWIQTSPPFFITTGPYYPTHTPTEELFVESMSTRVCYAPVDKHSPSLAADVTGPTSSWKDKVTAAVLKAQLVEFLTKLYWTGSHSGVDSLKLHGS